ncbi:MAG: hypothetical protein ACJ735_10280 [Actinomycetes bacterium]
MRTRPFIRLLTVGSAAAAVVAITSLPGHASAGGAPVGPGGARPDLNTGEAVGGYLAFQDYDVTSSSATVKVPAVTCGSATTQYGIGIYTVDASGSYDIDFPQAAALIIVNCNGGSASYSTDAYTATNGNALNVNAVQPGDTVVLSVNRTTNGTTAATHNIKRHDVESNIANYSTAPSGPDPYVLIGNALYFGGVPSFRPVKLSEVQVNGQYLGDSFHFGWAKKLNMVNSANGHKLVTTGGVAFGKNHSS